LNQQSLNNLNLFNQSSKFSLPNNPSQQPNKLLNLQAIKMMLFRDSLIKPNPMLPSRPPPSLKLI